MHYGERDYLDIENIDGTLSCLELFQIFLLLVFFFIFNLISDPLNYKFGKPVLDEIPYWVFNLYDFSHSLVIASIFLSITYFINRDFFFPMLAWPFHILLDVFTHSAAFFPTPILWPILNYKFDGIPWSNPYIWLSNIVGIIFLFLYRRKFKII